MSQEKYNTNDRRFKHLTKENVVLYYKKPRHRLSFFPCTKMAGNVGGDNRARTCDLFDVNEAL